MGTESHPQASKQVLTDGSGLSLGSSDKCWLKSTERPWRAPLFPDGQKATEMV